MEARKNAEGETHLQNADKYMETSFLKLKFSPDWDSAADELNKAATCFKVAKNWESCRKAHMRASEAYANSGGLFHAAKQLDQAVLICKEQNNFTEVVSLAERGGLLYRQAGSPESATQLLIKGAKYLEREHPDEALGLYEKAAETVGVEDRPVEAAQHLESTARLLVKLGRYDQAADTLHNSLNLFTEGGANCGRVVLGLVLVQIARGDVIAAGKVWSQWGGFCDGSQSGAANDIITGFSEQDGDLAKRGLSSPTVMHLDNEFAKLARDTVVPVSPEGDGEMDLC